MSFLFGSKPSAPAPIPADPNTDAEAKRKRDEAEAAALAEQRGAGRRSTIAGGASSALAERQDNLKARNLG